MLNINMEFKKGILFIRLDGLLNKRTKETFDNDVLPVVLDNELKYIVVNLDKVLEVDTYGIECLNDLNDIVASFNGKTTLCSLTNKKVKQKIEESKFISSFYETNNELTELGVMKLWTKHTKT